MSGKVLSAAILAAVCLATTAFADLRGPAELPPAGYRGQQFVDSRGCVFLRAGHGGRQTWVPRVARDRSQLCGYAPSGREVAVAAPVVTAPAPAPSPRGSGAKPGAPLPLPAPMQNAYDQAGGKPAKSGPVVRGTAIPGLDAAPARASASAPVSAAPAKAASTTPALAAASPARVPASTASRTAGGEEIYRLACPAATPVPQKFRVEGGGTRTLCTRGDGTLAGASFPRLVSDNADGRDFGQDVWSGTAVSTTTGKTITVRGRYARSEADRIPTPPPGYKSGWEDDRLNPDRGKQTAKGIYDQEEIWSRTTPAVPQNGNDNRKITIVLRSPDGTVSRRPGIVLATGADGSRMVRLLPDVTVSKSSKSSPDLITIRPDGSASIAKASAAKLPAKTARAAGQPAAAAAATYGGRLFVQVATFGVPANAEGTAGRLRGLGLPVTRSTIKGGALQVVYAGPFASAGEAQSALSQVRRVGFGDARIVQ